jgi:hypothetical protein
MKKNSFLCNTFVILGAAFLAPLLGCSGAGPVESTESDDIEQDQAEPEGAGDEQLGEAEDALTWKSKYAYLNAQGKLTYLTDNEGNRIPDFGYVGYNYGEPLPSVAVKKTISPVSGDNTSHIQNAVNAVGALPKDANGFRGAVLLKAGTYSTSNPVYVSHDGVVIRGEGSGTLIKSTRTGKDYAVVVLGPKDSSQEWKAAVSGTKVSITSTSVPIGQRKFNVSDVTKYKVGDLVVVEHAPKSAWFSAVGDGGTAGDTGWSALGEDFAIRYVRTIKAISGKEITVDAPFYVNLKSANATLSMFKYDVSVSNAKLHYKVGIENLRVEMETNSPTDTDHTERAVVFQGVIDGWAKGLTLRHFSEAGVQIWRSSRVTVQGSYAGSPISPISGGWRYNFSAERGAQQILFTNNTASEGRHGFVSNGRVSASGIVFHKSKLEQNLTCSEAHLHWTTGLLFDASEVVSHSGGNKAGFCLHNRGNYGTSHGWAAASSALWNIKAVAGTVNIVQKPPSSQNYAVGVDGATGSGPFAQPAGAIEGTGNGVNLEMPSLYLAQLKERQASGNP